MKKAILSLFFIGASWAVMAQVETTTPTTLTTTSNYQAYGTQITVPTYVESYFIEDYPTATEVMWWEAGDWYHATYNNSGRYNHVYYTNNGESFTVSLPVTQNFVPDDIIMKTGSMYGPMIYDITTLRALDGSNIYQVRLIQNGQLVSEWIDENGNKISDPFRSESTIDASTNTLVPTEVPSDAKEIKIKVDGDEMKIKTEHADGTETKTKVEDGKTKTKKDD